MPNHEQWQFRGDLKRFPRRYFGGVGQFRGVVYAAQLSDGTVKVGCSARPGKRLVALEGQLRIYRGVRMTEVAISQSMTNFQDVEKLVHRAMKHRRVCGEIFTGSIGDVEPHLFPIELMDDSVARIESMNNQGFLTEGVRSGLDRIKKLEEFHGANQHRTNINLRNGIYENLAEIPRLAFDLTTVVFDKMLENVDRVLTDDEITMIHSSIYNIYIDISLNVLGEESAVVKAEFPDGQWFIDLVRNPGDKFTNVEIIETLRRNRRPMEI